MARRRALLVLWGVLLAGALASREASAAQPEFEKLPLVRIRGGKYRPQLSPSPSVRVIDVKPFMLMTRPVRNDELLAFVLSHPEYQRDRIARAFADERYLAHWSSPTVLGDGARPHQPVTNVSWFVARAFCEAHGARLPSEAEWELVAAASENERDARGDAAFREHILAWYAHPRAELPDVPSGPKNWYGVSNMHGAIWEWVDDFNNDVVSNDTRSQGDAVTSREVCGGGALRAEDSLDYPAFLRLAFRSSLRASYTTASLGFRCTRDLGPKRSNEK